MKPYFSAESCSILQGLLCLDVKLNLKFYFYFWKTAWKKIRICKWRSWRNKKSSIFWRYWLGFCLRESIWTSLQTEVCFNSRFDLFW